MKINLFINYFEHPVLKRRLEYRYCFKKNLGLLNDKCQFDRVISYQGRPTFATYFQEMSKFPEDCNVLANLDIYFDETIQLAKNIQPDSAYCITRHEYTGSGPVTFAEYNYGHPGEWSQDCWVFTGNKILDLIKDTQFPLGVRGCDNHLAWLLKYHGFKVLNPAKDIRVIHYHINEREESGKRAKVGSPQKYMKVDLDHIRML